MEALRSSHKARGFADIGYHFYITRDGELHRCRPVNQIGAHAAGWNDKSIGICYEGGLDEQGRPADLRPALYLDGSATAITKGLSGGTHPRTLPIKPLHTQGLPLL